MKQFFVTALSLLLVMALSAGCSTEQDNYEEKNFTAGGTEITAVRIDVKDRKIELQPSKDGQFHLSYFENEKEFYEVMVDEEDTLVMRSASGKEWTDYIGGSAPLSSRTILLQIPEKNLSSLSLSTSNEDLSIPEFLAADCLTASNYKGNIVFESLNVGREVSLDAKDGDVSGSLAGSYEDFAITCNVKKGKSNLPEQKEAGGKSLAMNVNNGDAHILFSGATAAR